MILFYVGTQTFGTQRPITVPNGATGILAFSVVGVQVDPITGSSFNPVHAIISANLNSSFAQAISDGDPSLLAIGNTQFPKIPVSAGERLLVAFEANGSAVIYFDSAE